MNDESIDPDVDSFGQGPKDAWGDDSSEDEYLDAGLQDDEASYICGECGEEIVVPVDLSAGSTQDYVEDCPVCCRPNVIHVEVEPDGDVRLWSELE